MKTNWQTKKLGDIFQIERGGSPRPIEKFLTTDENGINWIKIGDTKNVTKYIYKVICFENQNKTLNLLLFLTT